MKSILIVMLLSGVAWGGVAWFEAPSQGNNSITTSSTSMTSPKYNEALFTDLSSHKQICFSLPGDKKRCVDTKWLYLLMVAAGIQED